MVVNGGRTGRWRQGCVRPTSVSYGPDQPDSQPSSAPCRLLAACWELARTKGVKRGEMLPGLISRRPRVHKRLWLNESRLATEGNGERIKKKNTTTGQWSRCCVHVGSSPCDGIHVVWCGKVSAVLEVGSDRQIYCFWCCYCGRRIERKDGDWRMDQHDEIQTSRQTVLHKIFVNITKIIYTIKMLPSIHHSIFKCLSYLFYSSAVLDY